MPNTDENTTLKALTDLSRFVWEQKRYFESVCGYATLETEKTRAQLLEDVAKKLDDIIVAYFSPPILVTPYLRQADARLKSHKLYYNLFV